MKKTQIYMGEILSCPCLIEKNMLSSYEPPTNTIPPDYISQEIYTELTQPLAPDSVDMLI